MTSPAAIIDTLDPRPAPQARPFPPTPRAAHHQRRRPARDARIRRIRTAQQKQGYGPLGTVNIVLCQTGLQTGTLENCTNDQLAAVEAMVNDIGAGRRLIEEVERQVQGARHELSDR